MSDAGEHPEGAQGEETASGSLWAAPAQPLPGAADEPPPVVPPPVVPPPTAAAFAPPTLAAESPGEAWSPEGSDDSGPSPSAAASERPEVAVGAVFAGGLVLALILKRLAR